ncbi:lytic polysaccharide monooxygenase [Nonomuraea sp. NPDC049158]|uniref:lytic polysaccharide monooxygenase auxiliary activity family 9 protein n=1 Tax=Nonomuraea sp. NPDC049158 TaxID=3155649 RepID=UPI0033FD7AF5
MGVRRRRIAGVAVVALGLLAGGLLLPAGPAGAHGALENPLSRAAACGADSPLSKKSPACTAALAVSGTALPDEWDNLRVADVAGQDREVIPDGKLCSGGIEGFGGLDLARADWPATRLTAGAGFTFRYRGTIPHKGTFRLYVTTDRYDPSRALRWSDLEKQPFLKVTDPAMADGSYVMKGRLPAGKSGRHLIYTIWQNSDTPDTYYSCSDVVFRAAKAAAAPSKPAPTDSAAAEPAPTDSAAAEPATDEAAAEDPATNESATDESAVADPASEPAAAAPAAAPAAALAGSSGSGGLPWAVGGVALLAAVVGAIIVLTRAKGRRPR